MTVLVVLAALVVLLLTYGWYLTWLASRLDRAHRRVERSWVVLDAALRHRAALLLVTTDPGQRHGAEREWIESRLTQFAATSGLTGADDAQHRVIVARRIHNDAVAVAQTLRRRRTAIVFRLAGHALEPRPFEMDDGTPPAGPVGADEAGLAEPRVAA